MPAWPQKTYFVYIMTNRSKALYTGVTNSLVRRVPEHKLGIGSFGPQKSGPQDDSGLALRMTRD
jgi:predicted GIY-YIG superfamily endonuclease